MKELVIVGGGPAAFSAAIYAGRYGREVLVITDQFGGQLPFIAELDNYPGFPEGTNGATLASLMQEQAARFEVEFLSDLVTAVDFSNKPLKVSTASRTIEAKAVILATGTAPRKLAVPGEDRLLGQGISYCATCDGFFYRGKTVAVIGGGYSAVEEAIALTRFASKIHLIYEGNKLRAGEKAQARLMKDEKIELLLGTEVREILGDVAVNGLLLRERKSKEERTLPVDGVFIYQGRVPNTGFLNGALELDPLGYIVADEYGRTGVEGVYAAGSVRKGTAAQVVTSAGSGAAAAMGVEGYLATLEE